MRLREIFYESAFRTIWMASFLATALLTGGCRKQNEPRKVSPVEAKSTNELAGSSMPVDLVRTNEPIASPTDTPISSGAPATNSTPSEIPATDSDKAIAFYNDGVARMQGDGVPQSMSEAGKFFRQAAELGHPGAQHNLGVLCLSGRGVTQDLAEAKAWLQKSADQGIAEAQFKLASIYANGIGVPQDFKEAVAWVRKAAEQGHIEAAYNLATLYVQGQGVEPDLAEAARWYLAAAEKGKAAAQSNMGVFYASGRGVKQDFAEANKWFRKAAEQGHPLAQFNLGHSYAEGKALEQDYIEAYKWYILAAGQGDKDAANEQLELGLKMSAVQVGEGIRRANKFSARLETNRPPVLNARRPATK